MASGGVERLRRRADYLRVQAAERRIALPGLLLQAAPGETGCCRVGFTASRKVGNAVTRNRMKRRFRALAAAALPEQAIAGADHVLIGREGGIERDHALLAAELDKALRRLAARHAARREVQDSVRAVVLQGGLGSGHRHLHVLAAPDPVDEARAGEVVAASPERRRRGEEGEGRSARCGHVCLPAPP